MNELLIILATLATGLLFYLTVIDARYYLLPNWANAGVALLGLLACALVPGWQSWGLALVGAASGAGIFWATLQLSRWWKGIDGVGWGDVKFAAAMGIWLGPQGVGAMLVLASLVLMLFGGAWAWVRKYNLGQFYVPFGVAGAPISALLIWAKIYQIGAGWLY